MDTLSYTKCYVLSVTGDHVQSDNRTLCNLVSVTLLASFTATQQKKKGSDEILFHVFALPSNTFPISLTHVLSFPTHL